MSATTRCPDCGGSHLWPIGAERVCPRPAPAAPRATDPTPPARPREGALTVEELLAIANILDTHERGMDSHARFAIRDGYGDNALLGSEVAERYMHGLYSDEAATAHRLRLACLRAVSVSENGNPTPAAADARGAEGEGGWSGSFVSSVMLLFPVHEAFRSFRRWLRCCGPPESRDSIVSLLGDNS